MIGNAIELSPRQAQVYRRLHAYYERTGHAPKYSEARFLLDVSSNQAVAEHIDRFVDLGLIARRQRKRRGIDFLASPESIRVRSSADLHAPAESPSSSSSDLGAGRSGLAMVGST